MCQVELHGDKTFSLKQQKYRVSEALKTGEATVLFGASVFPLRGYDSYLTWIRPTPSLTSGNTMTFWGRLRTIYIGTSLVFRRA